MKVRHKQIGYEARCTEPTAFDVHARQRSWASARRARSSKRSCSGVMVSVERQFDLKYVPFAELIDPETLKTGRSSTDSDFCRLARALEYQ